MSVNQPGFTWLIFFTAAIIAGVVVVVADVEPEDLNGLIADVRVHFQAPECKENITDGENCFYARNYEPPVEKIEAFKEFQAYLEDEYGFIVSLKYDKSETNSTEEGDGGLEFEISAIDPKDEEEEDFDDDDEEEHDFEKRSRKSRKKKRKERRRKLIRGVFNLYTAIRHPARFIAKETYYVTKCRRGDQKACAKLKG